MPSMDSKVMRDSVIDRSNYCTLKFWSMALIGVNLFLRGDEIIDLGILDLFRNQPCAMILVLSLAYFLKSVVKQKNLRNFPQFN